MDDYKHTGGVYQGKSVQVSESMILRKRDYPSKYLLFFYFFTFKTFQ